ncbi:integral membrane protein [Rutstroemia sp. NJR-2017a BBW]|nr:integral membrane protein [Rutstroemia sp. NJR-2017a BBW]
MSLGFPPEVLATLPALTPPVGVIPNFANPESRAYSVIVINGIFTSILIIFVALRMYAKVFVSKTVGWEDGEHITIRSKFLIPAAHTSLAYCILGTVCCMLPHRVPIIDLGRLYV